MLEGEAVGGKGVGLAVVVALDAQADRSTTVNRVVQAKIKERVIFCLSFSKPTTKPIQTAPAAESPRFRKYWAYPLVRQ